MRIDIRGLEAFLWVAELGSFRRAATHLNISQTAVSHRISNFENSLGLKLLNRTTRQVSLTKAGGELLPVGRSLISSFDREVRSIVRRHTENLTELNLACVPTAAVHLLPTVFEEFSRRHRTARVHVFDRTATEIGDMVAGGQAEFGVTLLGMDRWGLSATPLIKEQFLCVVPKGHRLARQQVIRWKDLHSEALVRFTAPMINRIVVDNALENHVENFNWAYEVQHAMTAVMLAQSNLAIAIVPRLAATELPHGLKAISLNAPKIIRTIGIVRRRGEPTSALAAEFQKILRAHAAKFPE